MSSAKAFISFILIVLTNNLVAQQTQDVVLIKAAVELLNARKYQESEVNCNQALAINPASAWGYNVRGLTFYYRRNDNEAIRNFNEALKLDSKYAAAYVNRGVAFAAKRDYGLAIQDYNEAIRLDPKMINSYVNLSDAHSRLGQYDLGIKAADEAIKIDPANANLYNTRGYAYELKGLYDEALKNYSEALRINPKFYRAYVNRGVSYKLKGLYSAAIEEFKKAIELQPSNGHVYVNIVSPLFRIDDYKGAGQFVAQFRQANPEADKYIRNSFGESHELLIKVIIDLMPAGNYQGALETINAALQAFNRALTPESKEHYIDMLAMKGNVLAKLGRKEEALDVYHQTLVVHPNQPEVREAIEQLKKPSSSVIAAVKDITGPSIDIISPEAGRGLKIIAAGSLTQIIGKAKDVSGISQVLINDKPAKLEDDGLFILNIALNPANNTIKITATDKANNTTNKTVSLSAEQQIASRTPATETPIIPIGTAPNYHVILIAGKDYNDPSIPDLENPIRDANELKAILTSSYTFDPANIDTLFNSSREDIMQRIIQRSSSLGENDNLLIFYAGHGIAEKDKFGDIDGYWIPSSATQGNTATYISSDDINKALKRSNSKHILVIADACFSGSFTRELAADASAGIQKQYAVASRKIMASGNMEPVPDNSKFIYYLKKNLKENKDRYLTAKKLFDSFYEAILNNSDTSPQYAPIKNVGDEGGEFVFIKK